LEGPSLGPILPFKVMALVTALLHRRDRHQFSHTVFVVVPLSASVGWKVGAAQFAVSKNFVLNDKAFENCFGTQLLTPAWRF
jgi:hypothetical protein